MLLTKPGRPHVREPTKPSVDPLASSDARGSVLRQPGRSRKIVTKAPDRLFGRDDPLTTCPSLIAPNEYIVVEDRQPIGRIRHARERTPPIWVWHVTVTIPGPPFGLSAGIFLAHAAYRTG